MIGRRCCKRTHNWTAPCSSPSGTSASSVSSSPDSDQSDRSIGRLARAYVDPQYWSLGVVRLLFDAAMEHLRQLDCERVTMWIMEPNHRARAAAEHLGMTQSGVRQPTCERATTMPAGVEDVEYMCRLRGTEVAAASPPTSGD